MTLTALRPPHDRPDLAEVPERLQLALATMQQSQSFIDFTDNKASTMLLVNSIFIATSSAAGVPAGLRAALVLSAVVSIGLCLLVVRARLPGPLAPERSQLVFWGHIAARATSNNYLWDFRRAELSDVCEQLVVGNHDLARVVARKFRTYLWAQYATFFTAALWVVGLLTVVFALL